MSVNHKRNIIKRCTIAFFMIVFLFSFSPSITDAFSEQVIQRGATGDDVIELQARLQFVGYYRGNIDGVFGWGTYWAVRNFQHDYGIYVDGLVGEEMKKKLEEVTWFDKKHVYGQIHRGVQPVEHWGRTGKGPQDGWPPPGQRDPGNKGQRAPRAQGKPTKPKPAPGARAPQQGAQVPQEAPPRAQAPQPGVQAPQPDTPAPQEAPQQNVAQAQQGVNIPEGFTENDIQLMANAVYGEARGEPYEGQVAIAAVILNRVKNPDFPNTVAGVIFEPLAFTAVADGQIWLTPNETARRAVMDAINGWDPTGGLVFYFNPNTATSAWMHRRERVLQIGKHVFLR